MKLQDLDESIRFGQREINEIDSKYGRRVLVGIEYEIEFPDLGKLHGADSSINRINAEIAKREEILSQPDVEVVDHEAAEQTYSRVVDTHIHRAIEKKKKKLIESQVQSDEYLAVFARLTFLRSSVVDIDDNYVKMMSEIGRIVAGRPISNNVDKIRDLAQTLNSQILGKAEAANIGSPGSVKFPQILSSPPTSFEVSFGGEPISLSDSMRSLLPTAQAYIKMVFDLAANPDDAIKIITDSIFAKEDIRGRIAEFRDLWTNAGYRQKVVDALEAKYDATPPTLTPEEENAVREQSLAAAIDWHTTSAHERAQEDIENFHTRLHSIYNGDDAVVILGAYFSNNGGSLDEYGIDPDLIRDVTREPSITNGAEVITKAIPLPDALDLMQRMFQFIKDKGATSEKTGMHMNVSIKGLEYTKNNFNPAKMIVLSDEKYITKYFPFRKWVESSFNPNQVSKKKLDRLVYRLAVESPEKQFEVLDTFITYNIVQTMNKHQTINTLASGSEYLTDLGQSRVEFRFPGDADYETKYDQLRWFLYRSIQMLLAGFDENYGKEEYLKMGLSAINKVIARSYSNMSLGTVVSIVKNRNKVEPVMSADEVEEIIRKEESITRQKTQNTMLVYRSKENPGLFIATNPTNNNVIWFNTADKIYGTEKVRRLDVSKYRLIQKLPMGSVDLIFKVVSDLTGQNMTPAVGFTEDHPSKYGLSL